MATGKINYFRHDFTTHRNAKMIELTQKLGIIGYAHYFILAEKCAELISHGHEFPLKFHESDLLRSLRLTRRKLDECLTAIERTFGLRWTVVERTFNIEWPNLLKYIGSHAPNKIKENKIKENKIILKEKSEKKENLKTDFEKSKSLAQKSTAQFLIVDNFQNLVESLGHTFANELKQTHPDKNSDWFKNEITHAIEWTLSKKKKRNQNGWKAFIRTWLKKADSQNKTNSNRPKTFLEIERDQQKSAYQQYINSGSSDDK